MIDDLEVPQLVLECASTWRRLPTEFSPNLDRLVKAAASKGAELHASKYGLENGRKLQSVLANPI